MLLHFLVPTRSSWAITHDYHSNNLNAEKSFVAVKEVKSLISLTIVDFQYCFG